MFCEIHPVFNAYKLKGCQNVWVTWPVLIQWSGIIWLVGDNNYMHIKMNSLDEFTGLVSYD